jgi:molybdopterin synthase catalytic subunit
MALAVLSSAPIDEIPLREHVSGPENGAVCIFVGQTRVSSRGRAVSYLEYAAYVPMAEKLLLRIAEQAETRWPCRVAIRHRLGRIDVGEASIVICVGSAHRAEAFEACRFCIDTVKETVPIWKREICKDGSFWIEGEEAVRPHPRPHPRPLPQEQGRGD